VRDIESGKVRATRVVWCRLTKAIGSLAERAHQMSRLHVFADEAGNFDFSRKRDASKHFIVATISSSDCSFGSGLLDLHREMGWLRKPVRGHFHATTDQQTVRDEVFDFIRQQDFEIQATIMEKSKAQPQTRVSASTFYQYGWHYHFRHGLARKVRKSDEVMLTVASIGTKKKQADFTEAVRRVVRQYDDRPKLVVAAWPASCDPCLQLADYCTWAIQRRWERGDSRSYELIKDRITYEYDLWERGTRHHY
jgi:hypothetical protein